MSRRRAAVKRVVLPDPIFHSITISKFINMVMCSGKKSIAERIVYQALKIVEEKYPDVGSVDFFEHAVNQVKPVLEVRSRRVGGATYQVPLEVRAERRLSLAFRWILKSARARSAKTMERKLALELIDAYENQGGAIKKRDEVHKMAEANRAFAHYRW